MRHLSQTFREKDITKGFNHLRISSFISSSGVSLCGHARVPLGKTYAAVRLCVCEKSEFQRSAAIDIRFGARAPAASKFRAFHNAAGSAVSNPEEKEE